MSSIITFYSFKGGVGRTMALANIAVLLAQRGKRVLAVDWDLEAPGLHDYFARRVDIRKDTGLLHLLHEGRTRPGDQPAWREHIARVDLPYKGTLDLLYAGSRDDSYARHLDEFDWHGFFSNRSGGAFVERLRDEWRGAYDFTLIDSRTGYTDSGGVCTILLPDMLVAVFSANEQSLFGVEEAIAKAQAGRQDLDVDRPPLLIVPLPSRFDGRVEVEEAERWTTIFTSRLAKYYDDWLPRGTSYRRVVERTRVPHVPFFSFGEKLPVLEHSLTDPEGMAHVYDLIARLFDDELRDADVTLLGERADPSAKQGSEELAELAIELEGRIESRLLRNRWSQRLARLSIGAGGLAILVVSVLALTHERATASLAAATGVIAATVGVVATLVASYMWATLRTRALPRYDNTRHLDAALDDLRVARRLDRERPGRLREAYEVASRELRAAEGEALLPRSS